MSLIVISSERFAEHVTPPGHPEAPERAEVMDVVAAEWRARGGEVVAPREASREQLARIHTAEHLRRMAETVGAAVALDPDTYTSPETYEVALLSAGAAIDAVERVMGGAHARAFALTRPPGHHAERDRAMGFCFFNNIAVAAAQARTLGAGRVAIVDYDVHHGNGTQHIFEQDPDVLYVSTHQYPYYPGTGAAGEIGYGAGAGRTVNLPLEVGATDDDYRLVFEQVVEPVLRQFGPDIVLVSAGFDAHERDPLGGMRLTTPAFAAMTAALRRVAEEQCAGRLVAVTEGGYDLRALGECMRAVVEVLSRQEAPAVQWPASPVASARGRAAATESRAALTQYWKF
ncbi:MAG TPA: histone deacetylase [Vicinamibacterales bacterium]|nr:histone deacetylase [Vicinamibacterales bacterium]